MADTKTQARLVYYCGHRAGHPVEVFARYAHEGEPTTTDFPQYGAVVGPFRTKRAAYVASSTYPNPHIQTVADAERVAKSQRVTS